MLRKWITRLVILASVSTALFFFVLFPVTGSFLLTNSRFEFPEPDTRDPESLGLPVSTIQLTSPDGIQLQGWWAPPPAPDRGTIILVHGLNRSRLEMLERGAEAYEAGYGVLLLDLRNHGRSQSAHTTLGIHESRDVCSAIAWAHETVPRGPIALWGVSLGASTALLAAKRCGPVDAVVADSAFLSFEETVRHHFRLIFGLPSFPVADLLLAYTAWRLDLDLEDGDVEQAVMNMPGTPILFIAGGSDRRMPPALAERLLAASSHPDGGLVIVEGATHGQAFRQDREAYLGNVFEFLDGVLP